MFAYLGYLYLTLPDVRQLATANPPTTAFMELRAREARAQGKEPRRVQRWVSYRRISPNLTRAVLVAEDAAFWQHEGVDLDELQKSIELDWARGQLLRGASTITQQLAKNLYLSPSRNPVRKLRELIIARRLEAALPKARILELYLNVIEWGDGIYGVEAAARTYFGTSASALGPRESALLAGAIINPRRPESGEAHGPSRPAATTDSEPHGRCHAACGPSSSAARVFNAAGGRPGSSRRLRPSRRLAATARSRHRAGGTASGCRAC